MGVLLLSEGIKSADKYVAKYKESMKYDDKQVVDCDEVSNMAKSRLRNTRKV